MQSHNCRPDSVVYNTIIGSLWATGLVWAHAKATQIFHAACRQGHFRLTVHTLEAGAAAGAAGPVGSPAPPAVGPAAAAAAALLPQALPQAAGSAGSAPGSGPASRSGSPPALASLPQAISLGPTSGSRQSSGCLATPDMLSPATCGTPLSALAACASSPSPGGSPLTEGSLAAAAALAVAVGAACGSVNGSVNGANGAVQGQGGTGAGTLIEFGMHAFTVGSAVLSLLRWVAELRERLPREPNKDLKQQVGAGGCWPPACHALAWWVLGQVGAAGHPCKEHSTALPDNRCSLTATTTRTATACRCALC